VKIYGEEANFRFTSNFVVFYPQEDSFFSHNERKYLPQLLSNINPAFLATLPAVVDAEGGAKVAIAESDLEEYRDFGCTALVATDFPRSFTLSAERRTQPRSRFQSRRKRRLYCRDFRKTHLPLARAGITDRDADLLTNPLVWLLRTFPGAGHELDQAGQSRLGLVE